MDLLSSFMLTGQSWKVFYTDTRRQVAKMSLVSSGENVTISKVKNIIPYGFINSISQFL